MKEKMINEFLVIGDIVKVTTIYGEVLTGKLASKEMDKITLSNVEVKFGGDVEKYNEMFAHIEDMVSINLVERIK